MGVGDGLTSVYRPELHAQPNPLDNAVEAHNAWVVGNPCQDSCICNIN